MAYTFRHGDRPLDGFTIQRAVGYGGFGEVYYAMSDGGREVALKYLRNSPEVELRGVSHCINLKSPHLVNIFDVKKSAEGEYFIVMEYISGPSLRDLLLAESQGLGSQKATFFLREIGKGLAYLHDRGIVHRDLKPGNIFYDDGYVKIGDYGLSKFISVSRHSAQTSSVGTVHYMAPEISTGNYSRGVDIYALGVILYEMLLGRVPFEGSTMGEVLMKHLTSQPEIDQLPEPFGDVIRRSLAKDPKDRFQTVDEMVQAVLSVESLERSLAGFSPQSLGALVRQQAQVQDRSPVPSPNPLGNVGLDVGPRRIVVEQGERFAKAGNASPYDPAGGGGQQDAPQHGRLARGFERVSAAAARQAERLGVPGVERRPYKRHADEYPPMAKPVGNLSGPKQRRNRQLVLSALLTLTVAIGLGFLVAACIGRHGEETGLSAGFQVLALTGGISLSRWLRRKWSMDSDPAWSHHLLRVLTTAPMLFFAILPLMDVDPRAGQSMFFSMIAVVLFCGWDKLFDRAGERIAVMPLFFMAMASLVFESILGGILEVKNLENYVLMTPGIVASAGFVIQAACAWRRGKGPFATGSAGIDGATGRNAPPPLPRTVPPPSALRDQVNRSDLTTTIVHPAVAPNTPSKNDSSPSEDTAPNSDGVSAFVKPDGGESNQRTQGPVKIPRSWPMRTLWALVSIGLVVCLVLSLVRAGQMLALESYGAGMRPWRMNQILVAEILACGLFFSLSRLSAFRFSGFWNGIAIPFLRCFGLFLLLFGLTKFVVHSSGHVGFSKPAEIVLLVGGLTMLLFGRRRKRWKALVGV